MLDAPTPKPFAKAAMILVGVTALLIGLWTEWQMSSQPTRTVPELASGSALPAPRPLTPFALIDHHGQPFDLARFKGAWTLLFFGYTHCPDVCPTTLATLNGVVKTLAASTRPPVHVVFVSVDPQRDTVQRLAEYVPYFNKDFIGVTGTPAQLDTFTTQLDILHLRGNEPAPDGGYTVDHSASILLIDPAARLTAIFSPPPVATSIAKDVLTLRNYYKDLQ